MEGSTKRLCYYRTSVRTIQWFDEFDHFPNRLKFAPTGYRETSYGHLNLYFKGIVDNYVQVANRTSKHPKTIRVEANAVSSFLFHLQQNGAIDLCGITESMILSFFYDGCRQLRGCSYRVTKTNYIELKTSTLKVLVFLFSQPIKNKVFSKLFFIPKFATLI
jgi:hypothetical protein